MTSRAAHLGALAVTLAGCGLTGFLSPSGGPYPEACASFDFAPRQCQGMVVRAQRQAGLAAADVAAIEILPPTQDGVVVE